MARPERADRKGGVNDVPNRYGRTPEELEEARARIEDARQRAEAGLMRDDSAWGQRKLDEERRKRAIR